MKGASLYKSFSSSNNTIKLDSDVDYTFSTDQMIKGTFKITAKVRAEDYDEDWHYEPIIIPNSQFTTAHFPLQRNPYYPMLRMENIPSLILNKSITSAKMRPTSSYNYVECFPKFQAEILPYLTDTRLQNSQLVNGFQSQGDELRNDSFSDMLADSNPVPVDAMRNTDSYRYDPMEDNYLFVVIHNIDNDDLQAETWNFVQSLIEDGQPQSINNVRFKWRPDVDFPDDILYENILIDENEIGEQDFGLPMRPVYIGDGDSQDTVYDIDFSTLCLEAPLGIFELINTPPIIEVEQNQIGTNLFVDWMSFDLTMSQMCESMFQPRSQHLSGLSPYCAQLSHPLL